MSKRAVIIVISSLIVGLSIGIGITYYVISDSSKKKSSARFFEKTSPRIKSATTTVDRNKMATLFDCPCGSCSDKLFECKCARAKEITGYLNSLIDRAISEDGIRDRMVEKYGDSIIGDRDKMTQRNRESMIGNDKPIPPFYEAVEGVALPTTLDPETVSEKAREAYGIARDFPELLVQMPCYCGCEKAWGSRMAHKSLLDCFADRHGENCRICVEEAIFARDKTDQGIKPEEIREVIIEKRGRVNT